MDDRQFLSSVLAWESGGYVNVHWHRTGWRAMPGRSCQSFDEALGVVDELMATQEVDIYFCLSTQHTDDGKRSRDNADKLRAVWIDADVGDGPKKYANPAEAVKAIYAFCKSAGIPYPSFIVLSGKGVHAYWGSDRDLTVGKWQPVADALKAAATKFGLKFDAGVTSDAARVLRWPSTNNWKYVTPENPDPLPVRLMPSSTGMQYDFGAVFSKLFASASRHSHAPSAGMADAFKHLDAGQKLTEGLDVAEVGLMPFEPIAAGCGWLREVHATGGAKCGNELWNLSVLCATFMQDGHNLAHEFSFNWVGKNGEIYSFPETEKKWDYKFNERRKKNIGWPYCRTINAAGASEHCSKCPRLEKGKSPLTLGLEANQHELVDQELEELGGTRPPELRLPEGYCQDPQGRIAAHLTGQEYRGRPVAARLVWLINSSVRDPELQLLGDIMGIKFIAQTSKISEVEIFLTVPELYNDGGLLKKLTRHNIVINPEALSMAEKFATSWLDKLKIEDTPTQRDPGTIGWRYEQGQRIGFAFANRLYHESGEVLPLLNPVDEFNKHYMPIGSRDAWLQSAKLLTDRKRPELDILISVAFASPLTVFAGTLYGPVLVLWGQPGTAKSAGQQVGAAVYGHPKQTRESLNSTSKSILKRLGLTRNLPSWWDDIQDERHLEALFQTMFVSSEGTEGGRLNQDASYKERLQWQSILVSCANASFVEFLTRKQKSTTAGMRRVFEIEFNKDPRGDAGPGMINALEAGKTFQLLEHNYGVIGMEYAAILGREHKLIERIVQTSIDRFTRRVAAVGDEQFWVGLCGILIVGAMYACRLGAKIDVHAMEEFLVQAFLENRWVRATEGTESGTYEHTAHAITGFLNHYFGSGNFLVTKKIFENRHIDVGPIKPPNVGHPVYIQIARDQRAIAVSRSALRKWLDDNDIRSRQVYAGLEKYFFAKEVRLTLGAGTTHAQTQERVIVMVVNDDRSVLYDLLTGEGRPARFGA